MKKILWVSPYVPYDNVGHAGGKIENYYIKRLAQNKEYKVYLISFFNKKDVKNIDLSKYGIDSSLFLKDVWYKPILNIESTLNPFNRYAGSLQNFYVLYLKKALKAYKNRYGNPNIVILQWTQTVLLAGKVSEIFKNVPIIGIEEDVQFQSYKRYFECSTNIIQKMFNKIRYTKLRKIEIESLKIVDKVCVNNFKDKKILIEHGIDINKVFEWVPWFDNYDIVNNVSINTKDILFFGAMNRKENYLSVIWFIENVMNILKDEGYKFIVVGSNPHNSLYKYESKSVIIKGFVDDVSQCFSNCLCLVAPLVLGAGVKIKVLEAMSAGIPVLTNDIGIEGIQAVDGRDFIFCKTKEDYIANIRKVYNNIALRDFLKNNSKEFIRMMYNIEKSSKNFEHIVGQLVEQNSI